MDRPRPSIGFSSIELTKDFIGVGSYGAVYKARCNEHLECAAKVIHSVLITEEEVEPGRLHRLPLKRFLKEIEFLGSIRHPNIIGYLGTSWDANKLPVLLMELMDGNLTQFLTKSQKPLHFSIEVNICRDIALALSFLHSNNIVHRDLSSNNVLMLGDRQAKVTDFGMATIFEDEQVQSATKMPGATVYMPPEVRTLYPITSDKIDCFSFGVLCVQIMTRKFPKPEEQAKGILGTLKYSHEISCRQSHISTISKAHPLLPVALSCLKDRYKSRPSSSDICIMLGGLKNITYEHIDYVENTPLLHSSSDNESPPATPSSSCMKKPKQTEAEKEETCLESSVKNSQNLINQLDGISMKSEEEVDHLLVQNSDIEPVKNAMADIEWDKLTDQEINSLPRTKPNTKPVLDMSQNFNTRWSIKSTKPPQDIYRTADAVYLDDGQIYMLCGPERRTAYSFHPVKYYWMRLEETVQGLSSLTAVGSFVVTVGGTNGLHCSNKLYSYVGFHWMERLPPMPTRRYNTIIAMSGPQLIVAGGVSRNKTILTTVELLSMDNYQWSTVASLPEPSASFSGHVSSGKVWVLGYSSAVFSCYLDRLVQSGSRSLFSLTKSTIFMPVWSYDSMPVHSTTLISMNDELYAIGGKLHDTNMPTDAVYKYDSWNSCWSIISHMKIVRSHCMAVGISQKRMIVVMGGVSEKGTPIKLVEMTRLLPTMDKPE